MKKTILENGCHGLVSDSGKYWVASVHGLYSFGTWKNGQVWTFGAVKTLKEAKMRVALAEALAVAPIVVGA